MAGLAVGSLTALLWMAEVQGKRLLLEQEGATLQSRLKQVQNRLEAEKVRQAEQKTWQQQAAHVHALKVELKAWDALHQALLQETGPDSVQLLRLQLDSQTLELHGQAIDVQRMAVAHARLSVPLADTARDSAWTIVSLMNASDVDNAALPKTKEFVWQVHWPHWGQNQVAVVSQKGKLQAESRKGQP